ncbi:MAG: helix-turn-helix domain-containing protein [Planctomycetes bacterium]|nr:helix-turn-helix domain-containing protein [Planctomycetota bacterium]
MLAMIIEEIRKQIKISGQSLNQIGRETSIDKAALSRIMNGGSCKAETLEVLLNHFGYEIRKKKVTKKSRAKK